MSVNNVNKPSNDTHEISRRDAIKSLLAASGFAVVAPYMDITPESSTQKQITEADLEGMVDSVEKILGNIDSNLDSSAELLERLGFELAQEGETITLNPKQDPIPEELRVRWENLDDETMMSEIIEYYGSTGLEQEGSEHHEDPNALTYDRLGTGYFTYALAKIVAQGFPSISKKVSNTLADLAEVPQEERKDLIPHFSRVDFGVSLALVLLSYQSAQRAGDTERIHHITESVTETVVASAKVGVDIMLSIFNAKLMEPIVDANLKRLQDKYKDEPKKYKAALYLAIQKWATLGSGFISTNLGVSLSRKFIWEYARTGDDAETGLPIYDMNLVYALTAQVADLTGDVALANPIIAAGDIAPREIAGLKLGIENLHIMSVNAIPKRLVATVFGFPAVLTGVSLMKHFGFRNNRVGGRDQIDPHLSAHEHETDEDLFYNEEELEAQRIIEESKHEAESIESDAEVIQTKTMLRSISSHFTKVLGESLNNVKEAFTNYPKMVKKDFEHAKMVGGMKTYNGIPEHVIAELYEYLVKVDIQIEELELEDVIAQFKEFSPKMGAALEKYMSKMPDIAETVQKYSEEEPDQKDGRQSPKMEHLSEISVMIAAIRRIPGVGPVLAKQLEVLQALIYVPVSFTNVEHTIGGTLAEALNVLPYQLLNAFFVAGVIQKDFHNFRSADFVLDPLDQDTENFGNLALQNQNIHIPLMLLSGVADNGFALSILLQILISDGKALKAAGHSEEMIDNYLTLEIQKAYDAAQAGGAITMLGCSAHFNNLTLATMGVAQSTFVGLPSASILFALSCAVNAWSAKNGIFRKLNLHEIKTLQEGDAATEHANVLGFDKRAIFTMIKNALEA